MVQRDLSSGLLQLQGCIEQSPIITAVGFPLDDNGCFANRRA